MKRVIINNIYFPEGTGGGEMVVRKRAEVFSKNGDTVLLIVPGEKTVTESINSNFSIQRFHPIHMFLYKNAGLHSWWLRLVWHVFDMFNIFTFFQIKKILKKVNPDVVECHNLKGVGFLIPAAIRVLSIPYTHYLHDVQLSIPSGILLFNEEKSFFNNGLFQKLYERLTISLFGSPDEVISPSAWLKEYYLDRGFFKKSKVTLANLVTNSIDSNVLTMNINQYREKLKKNEHITAIFIGKLEVYKGVELLLSVWKDLPKSYILKVFGAGSYSEKILELQKQGASIQFFNYVSHDELLPHLKKADVLIMPTLCYENRPEVIIEALREGVPVIASRIGGIPELITNNENGFLFTPGSKEELSKLLL